VYIYVAAITPLIILFIRTPLLLFLLLLVLIGIEEKKAQGGKRESVLLIRRTLPSGETREYKVIDNPTRLSAQEWEQRVVAVFASGQLWQFKDWRWSSPVDLFQHTLGVHLCMEGRNVDAAVLSWNCKVLKVCVRDWLID
jgi:parafibromin